MPNPTLTPFHPATYKVAADPEVSFFILITSSTNNVRADTSLKHTLRTHSPLPNFNHKYLYAPEVIPLIVPLTFACSLGVYMGFRQLRLETTRWETHPHFLGIQVNPKTRWLPNYKDEDRTETK